jgi:quercetin dioxygenase-like cupin family protein
VGYSVAHIEDVQPSGPGNAVRFMRRELGAEAFGINWFELPPNTEGYEHDETRSGQEEIIVVVKGSGTWRVDGEEIPARAGTFLRFDPDATRCAISGPEGITFVAVGAPRGSYEVREPF